MVPDVHRRTHQHRVKIIPIIRDYVRWPVARRGKLQPRVRFQVRSDVPRALRSAEFFGEWNWRDKILAEVESMHGASERHHVRIQEIILGGNRDLKPFLTIGRIKLPLIEGERSHRLCRLTDRRSMAGTAPTDSTLPKRS